MAVMDEIGKFDVKANVVPNVLEKYMAFIFDSNFFDTLQFINSILDTLVKNLSKSDFKCLSQEW